MKIAIANDHSAVELKNIIKEHLESKGYEVLNLGTDSTESCDYPVYGEKVGRAVADGEADLGIAICGTGVGISLAANKVKGHPRMCLQRAVHSKAFQNAQQLQHPRVWCTRRWKRTGKDDRRRVAWRKLRGRTSSETC